MVATMMQVGDLVRHIDDPPGFASGIVIQMREGAFENQPLAQVFWPHLPNTGWVEAIDMEVINESR